MDQLQQRGLIVKKSRVDILSNTLAIVVPVDSRLKLSSARDLAGLRRSARIAVAEPQSVPAGIYAKAYLRKLKVWDRITDKLVPTDNVRSALAAVESGNVEAGIVYKTDALISHAVRIALEIREKKGRRSCVWRRSSPIRNQKAAAQKFLDYLRSEAGQADLPPVTDSYSRRRCYPESRQPRAASPQCRNRNQPNPHESRTSSGVTPPESPSW